MRCLIAAILLLIVSLARAQNLKDITIDPSANGMVFTSLLAQLEQQHNIDFIGDMKRLEAFTVQGIEKPLRLTDFLETYAGVLRIIRVNEKIIAIADRALLERYEFQKASVIVLSASPTSSQLKGNIVDALSESGIIGAQVYLPEFRRGVASDERGSFTLPVSDAPFTLLQIKFVGYDTENIIIAHSRYSNQTGLSVKLFQTSKELEGVTVTADRINENVVGHLSGVEKLSIETIKKLPTFMGEVDPIRSLTTLPGVSTAGELASGFNVRGGESGQNLVMQDGATIYNPSHLFGFFSAFNPDMVNDITLYKGAGPANFGGRISSVLDVALKRGDATRHTVSGGVGPIASRLTVQGPIVKNKTSYMIGSRVSYINWMLGITDDMRLQSSLANFRDFTATIVHKLTPRDFISISAYHSYDDFKLETDSVFSWQTLNGTLKWDHTFNDRLYSKLTITSSNYRSNVDSQHPIEKFQYVNSIRNLGGAFDVTFAPSEHSKFTAGVDVKWTRLEPGKLVPAADAYNVSFQDMQDQRQVEAAAFIQADHEITDRLSFSAGLRYSHFIRFGPEDIYGYDYARLDGRYPTITDTTHYAKGSAITNYSGIEPRVSLRFLLTPNTSIKASYYRGYQYLHLISNTTSTTPQDYWVSSGPLLRPQRGDQFSAGYFQNFKDNMYEFSIEGFYKNIDNAIDYMEGADITLNPILEAGLSQGKGMAYGGELFLKKSRGQLNGWISYTYSRSLRKFTGSDNAPIVINEGAYYASAFDQPHVASLVLNYRIGTRIFLGLNFNYSSGRPITIPISKFSYDVYLSVLNYSQRNEYRIPDYHRLDLSFTLKDKPHKISRYRGEWIFSLFNAYGRKNAYSISFDRYGVARKLSILGTAFPSLSYNFSF